MTTATCIKARDPSDLLMKLYAANGLHRDPTRVQNRPGTLAERHAIQRLYTIRRTLNGYCATPKDAA